MISSQRDFAVLGGSFDPVHQGHISIAETISESLGARVCLVPVGVPAHKSSLVASRNRGSECWSWPFAIIQAWLLMI